MPPSGRWHGTFTSRIVGQGTETAYFKFHPDGRVTGRSENKFVKCAVDGTYDRATGAFTSTGTSGNFRAKNTGTITGHTLEMQFETMDLDSGPVTLTFVDPSDPSERVSTRAAAGWYMGCAPTSTYPCCPILACMSAEDENTLRECYWVCFPCRLPARKRGCATATRICSSSSAIWNESRISSPPDTTRRTRDIAPGG